MATTTFSFRQGDSYTIGIRLDANYDILGLQEIKVSLFGNTFAPNTTVDPRVFKIEISSDESAALSSSYYPLELLLDDVNFGVKKFVLAIAYATPSATASNGSINTGYDIILDVKISDTPIEITSTVITLVKGEKGDKGDKGDQGADSGVADGNKGDITVSSSGSNWAINALSVTLAKIATAAYSALNTANTLVQRNSNGSFAITNIDFATITIPNVGRITGAQLTTSTTNPDQVVDSFDGTLYRSAKYFIQITSGSDTHASEILVSNSGLDPPPFTQYANINNGGDLATFRFELNGSNVRLLVTPVSAITKIKVFRITMEA